jgi:hypothetical protein
VLVADRVCNDAPMSPEPDHLRPDDAHDILAAEEFGVPAPDPDLHADETHDVLAADEFEVGAADPALHHGPLQVPDDPSGITEPHDVLAAEEFPMPAGHEDHGLDRVVVLGVGSRLAAALAGLSVAVAIALRRRRK